MPVRSMDATAQGVLQSNYVRPGVFAELHFVSSVEYVWSGYGTILWNGQTWKGLGELASISTITEDSTLTAQGITIGLTGIDSTLLSEALGEIRQGLPMKLWLVFFDASGNVLSSVMCYAGRMDQDTITEDPLNPSISIAVENRLADLQRAPFRRLTDQDQRARFPNDDGFKYVNYLQDWNGAWGSN